MYTPEDDDDGDAEETAQRREDATALSTSFFGDHRMNVVFNWKVAKPQGVYFYRF